MQTGRWVPQKYVTVKVFIRAVYQHMGEHGDTKHEFDGQDLRSDFKERTKYSTIYFSSSSSFSSKYAVQ